MKSVTRFAFASATVLSVAGSASAQFIIDDFSSGDTNMTLNGTGHLEGQQAGTGIVGGQRDVLLDISSNPFNRNAQFEVVSGQGASFLSNGPGVTSHVGLDYDGLDVEGQDGVLTASGSGLNLNFSNLNALQFDFLFADLGLNTEVEFFTYGGGSSMGQFMVPEDLTSPQQFTLNFNTFTSTSGSGVDFSDVDRIMVRFNADRAATDFGLARMSAVPEPGTMLAMGAGLAALLRKRRRKVA